MAIIAGTPAAQETIELLLDDTDWLEAEFAAIMTASGFGNRLIVGTSVAEPAADLTEISVGERAGRLCREALATGQSLSRVRSPPVQ